MRTQQPACRCCLAVDGKLVSIHTRDFAQLYQDVVRSPVDCKDRFPQHVCTFCLRLLQKYSQFRVRCHKALDVLYRTLMHGKEVTRSPTANTGVLKQHYVQTRTLTLSIPGCDPHVEVDPLDCSEAPIECKAEEEGKCEDAVEELLEPKEEASEDVVCSVEENGSQQLDETDDDFGSFPGEEVKQEFTKPVARTHGARKCESRTDKRAVAAYAESVGFRLTDLSLDEQIKDIEEKKRQSGFVCERCGKRFNNSNCLDRHKHYHEVKPKSFVCDLCSWVFKKKGSLIEHVLSHRFVFSCKSCSFKTNMRGTLKTHRDFHMGKRYPCKYCDKVIVKATSYFSHVKFKHEAELPWCDLCGEAFVGDKGLVGHKKLIHNNFDQYPYTCACNKRFRSEAALDRHLIVKGCELPSCVHCGESFPVAQMLKRHLMERHIEGALPDTFECKSCVFRFYNHAALTRHACGACAACAQCGDSFETTQQLLDHTALKHPKLTCHECSRQYKSVNYKTHFLKHAAPGPAAPRPRGRAPRPAHLTVRWRVRGGRPEAARPPPRARTHVCERCGAGFLGASGLGAHRLSSGCAAPRHRCPLCRKDFRSKISLQNHTRVHTGERPYQCAQCPKAFKQRSGFTRHLLVHSGVRSHVCSICDKSFQTSSVVKLHIKTVHMKMPWPARKPRTRPHRRKDAAQCDAML